MLTPKMFDDALLAQARAREALDTLAVAHDGGCCAAVQDHRDRPWGVGPTTVYTYPPADVDPVRVCPWEPDRFPEDPERIYAPVDHGGLTLVREKDSEAGHTLHAFTTARRNDAPAVAYEARCQTEDEARLRADAET